MAGQIFCFQNNFGNFYYHYSFFWEEKHQGALSNKTKVIFIFEPPSQKKNQRGSFCFVWETKDDEIERLNTESATLGKIRNLSFYV